MRRNDIQRHIAEGDFCMTAATILDLVRQRFESGDVSKKELVESLHEIRDDLVYAADQLECPIGEGKAP